MTWLDLLRKSLPNSAYAKMQILAPSQCPYVLLGGKAPDVNDKNCKFAKVKVYGSENTMTRRQACLECWNSEVPEDERRK